MNYSFKTRQLLTIFPWLDGARMRILAWICNHGISFFDCSYRLIKVFPQETSAYLLLPEKPVLFALYHGRMVAALGLKPRHKLTILISESRDGEMIARGAHALGFSIARGSPARGAVKGTRQLLDAANSGQNLVFMVDGPRGPKYEVKPGVIRLAELAQMPIVPLVCSARSTWWMKSWDSFMAPWWSTPILYLFGKPISVPQGISQDEQNALRIHLESIMKELQNAADGFWHCTN